MQSSQGFRQAFIITCQSPKTRCPSKVTLDHPATRQKNKLDGLSQLPDLGAVLLIGGSDMQGQQMPQGINGQMHFAAPFAFAPS